MSVSLILSNFLFCTLAIACILPVLGEVRFLTYKRGIPLFFFLLLIVCRMFIPNEFYFTQTIPSRNILPVIRSFAEQPIYGYMRVRDMIFLFWGAISAFFIIYYSLMKRKALHIFRNLPLTNNELYINMVREICIQKNIRHIPKIAECNIQCSPFIAGYFDPMIILPDNLSEAELRYSVLHELEHYRNHHLALKSFIEILTFIFWWNPIIWIFKNTLLQSMEFQVDRYLTYDMTEEETLSYAETIVKIAKQNQSVKKNQFAIPFVRDEIKNIKSRVNKLLESSFQQEGKSFKYHVLPIFLSIILLLGSAFYTFESAVRDCPMTEGSISVDMDETYYIQHKDGTYSLYVDGEFISRKPNIQEELKSLKVYKE